MGFGQEIKDFIAGREAGEKIATSKDDREYKKLRNRVLKQKADTLDDPDMKGLAKRKLEAQIKRLERGHRPTDPSLSEYRRKQGQLLDLQIDRIKNPLKVPSAADSVAPYAPPPSSGTGKRSALDVGQEYDTSSLELPEDEEDDELAMQPTNFASRGGAVTVRGYADGGAVEEELDDAPADDVDADELDREDALEDDGDEAAAPMALPVDGPQRTAAAAPQASTGNYSVEAGHDAAKAGVTYAAKALGHTEDGKAVSTDMSARRAGQKAYLTGQGASTPDEMAEVAKAVDPEGKMSESERTFASLATVYEHYLRKNDPKAADRAAASMVQYFRQVSDRYKALMVTAANSGDLDGTMKMALRAHANVPDGKDMKLEKTANGKIKYSMTDIQTGKVVEQTIATPEEILGWASKGAMHNFDDLIVRSSSDRASYKGKATTKDDKAPTMSARDAAMEKITSVAEKRKGSDTELSEPVNYLASQIVAQNDMAADDALDIVGELATVGDSEPAFKIQKQQNGSAVVTLKNGRTVRLSKDATDNMIALRGKAKVKFDATRKAAADKDAAAKKRTALETEQREGLHESYRNDQRMGVGFDVNAP